MFTEKISRLTFLGFRTRCFAKGLCFSGQSHPYRFVRRKTAVFTFFQTNGCFRRKINDFINIDKHQKRGKPFIIWHHPVFYIFSCATDRTNRTGRANRTTIVCRLRNGERLLPLLSLRTKTEVLPVKAKHSGKFAQRERMTSCPKTKTLYSGLSSSLENLKNANPGKHHSES